jgi:ABC-type branched-subunit amino acid transport system substrate-binding protein
MGVNSGSSQIAAALGPLAQGMVFAQVVPSPWERKHALAREFQDAMRRAHPGAPLSYGAIEGYMTAKALVMLLDAAGRDLSREGLLKAMATARLDLGGITLRYAPDDHAGASFVDLSIVSRDGRFLH